MASATPTFSTPNDSIAREVLVRGLWLSIPLAGLALLLQRAFDLGPAFVFKSFALFWLGVTAVRFLARRHLRAERFGAANAVTLARGGLVALLCAYVGEAPIGWMASALGTAVLLLDGVDGWLARRLNSMTAFGARFDMETDALLLLVLTVLTWQYGKAGPWILLAGLMRYAFVVAARAWPRLARPLPPSQRRKTAYVLNVAAVLVSLAPWVVQPLSGAIAFGGLAVLATSFAIDLRWLVREPGAPSGPTPVGAKPQGER